MDQIHRQLLSRYRKIPPRVPKIYMGYKKPASGGEKGMKKPAYKKEELTWHPHKTTIRRSLLSCITHPGWKDLLNKNLPGSYHSPEPRSAPYHLFCTIPRFRRCL